MAPRAHAAAAQVLYLIILGVLISLATATPIPEEDVGTILHSRVDGGDNTPPAIETGSCKTERSEDYYGLGVRLGIYLTWCQAWIAFHWVPSEIAGALDANTIFLFAVVVAMARCTITELIVQVDALILMHLGAGFIFSIMSIWGYRTSHYIRDGPDGISHFGGFGMHMRLLLCVAFASYGLFFWLRGIHGPSPSLKPGTGNEVDSPYCEPLYTFMFSKVLADGGVRYFYIVCTTGSLVYWGVQLLWSSIAAVARPRLMYKRAKAGQWRTTTRLAFATGFNYKELRYIYTFLQWGTLAWIIYSIILVEFTLNYNRLYNVVGWRGHLFFPSQLIPLIIGICGFLRVIYVGFEQWRAPQDTDPSLPADQPISPVRKWLSMPHGRGKLKLFAPKTISHQAEHKDDETDPLLYKQPTYLRYLVSYLPWLVLVRWWHLHDRDYERSVYGEPNLQVAPLDTTRRKHESWNSEGSTIHSPRRDRDFDHSPGYQE